MRFTQTVDAFYLTALSAPNDSLVVDAPVPYVPGLDQVTVVGGSLAGTVVPSDVLANGSLRLNVSEDVRNADQYAWVFKIAYDNSSSGSGSGGSTSGSSRQLGLSLSTWILGTALACFGALI